MTAADGLKSALRARVLDHRDDLLSLSRRIHAHPETAFEEHRAAAWCAEFLRGHGFDVTAPAYGLDTAFAATVGSGPVTVALACEYDALPGLGHACGHNLIAAAGLGAALALAPYADELGLTVRVLGTPAEERGAGKALMLEAGAFEGVDAAMMVHPCPFEVAEFRSFALGTLSVAYTGKAAHPSLNPHEGRNAADALTVAQVALGLLRQQLPPHWKVHGVTTGAGTAPNLIPDRATAEYEIRASAAEDLRELRERVEACFRAGALATGCEVELTRPEPDYLDFRTDAGLISLWQANARALGRPEPQRRDAFACTDMGNVSHAVPSIHPVLDISGGACGPHEPEFVQAAVSPMGERALLDGAVGMAWTAADFAAAKRA
ncbi:M20 family metallopeptidase [Streptomyces albireticuli]|uniref:Peptidase M20 domain-containing protein 2 n=1 Tax=Streptomyces albireticuli TaxID=1940 RepID=A0A2A2DCV1_9ACTN|nr:M20 family metallopeptidase [Streptomyces albireticuli]MCD9141038.1 M20 family metallopeptidase [Streptomyces albireticuli]MCD9161000.1 M20 family metallopeptidase [Streptomyces albireticuli]MCD9190942.1 M20 family metallopeptidase [Streptomyces albireticuli]PAU49229.1 peptidase M20 [Streptomyces albireticuli]